MQELISPDETETSTLNTAVLRVLENELRGTGTVLILNKKIVIQISRATFEWQLGNLLQQIYQVIDQQFPKRGEHLSIIIKDMDAQHEQVFKIWKTTQ